MDKDQQFQQSQLFTLRAWVEKLADGQLEVRLKVQHVLSGETRSFRDLTGVQAFLLAKLQQLEGEADLMHPEE